MENLKYRGVLLGALIGDCLGKVFEGIWGPDVGPFLKELENVQADRKKFKFTDDTALTRAVCQSLIERKCLDAPHLARTLADVFAKEPNRGYAQGAVNMFIELTDMQDLDNNCYKPALSMFDGSGSFGNGSGMRAAPIALYGLNMHVREMMLTTVLATKLTHSHELAVIGALLQCFAIQLAFSGDESKLESNPNDFLEKFWTEVIQKVEYFERKIEKNLFEKTLLEEKGNFDHVCVNANKYLALIANHQKFPQPRNETYVPYSARLKKLKKLYEKCRKGEVIDLERFYMKFANCGVQAIESIPVALFAFLIATNKNCEKEVNSKLRTKDAFTRYGPIERVIFYAIALGGDTDTIASMAGAIAGALFNSSRIGMNQVLALCEGYEDAIMYADKLHEISIGAKKGDLMDVD